MTKIPEAMLTEVVLGNYRSIRSCQVPLEAFTCLVGPNGSGKSNFLDALRLVGDSLRWNPDMAVGGRGGFLEVRSRGAEPTAETSIRLDGRLADRRFRYVLTLAPTARDGFAVHAEWCGVWFDSRATVGDRPADDRWLVRDGSLQYQTSGSAPVPSRGRRLYLASMAGVVEFSPVYEFLAGLTVFSVNPDAIRAPQPNASSGQLERDGANLALVLRDLEESEQGRRTIERMVDYLGLIVPGLVGVRRLRAGPWETLEFLIQQAIAERDGAPWVFPALSVSDGTLRAAGVLAALFANPGGTVVGIEEPENALNPAASGVLLDALLEASEHRQVLVTSHSPDLLDTRSLRPEALLAVRRRGGDTVVDRPDDAARLALTEELYTAGELLRVDQLQPRGAEPGEDQ